VELMRSGVDPAAAAAAAIRRIAHVYPSSAAGIVAMNMTGDYGKRSPLCRLGSGPVTAKFDSTILKSKSTS